MDLLSVAEEAELHREIYVALIRGRTRAPGAKQHLAHRAGITPQYLSYLLVLDDDPARGPVTRRQASVAVARRISAALPGPQAHRQAVFDHMVAARGCSQLLRQTVIRHIDDPGRMIQEVRDQSGSAIQTQSPELARQAYLAVLHAGELIARDMAVRAWPIEYVELCLCLHDSLCVLDAPARALQYARYGEAVLDWVDPARYRATDARVRELEINIIRAIGVAYNNMNLPLDAAGHFERAQRTHAYVAARPHWIGHVHRDLLSTWAKRPRGRLSEVEGLAGLAIDTTTDAQRELGVLLLQAKLGECYLAIGGPKNRAGPLMDRLVQDAERSTALGPLHRAIIYRTYALYRRQRADSTGTRWWAAKALEIAQAGGLTHQARGLRELFSAELGVPPDP